MNYSHIFSKAWRITRTNPSLWLLGILASLALAGGDDNTSFIRGNAWLFQNLSELLDINNSRGFTLLITAILLWAVGTLARIGLIHGVSTLSSNYDKSSTKLKAIFHISIQSFLPVISMQLLVWSPFIIWGIISSSLISSAFNTQVRFPSLGFGFFSLFIIPILGTILLYLPLLFIDAFAYRSIVLEKMSVKASLQYTATLLKNNLISILLLAFMVGILSIIFSIILLLALSPFLLLFMKPMMTGASQCMLGDSDFSGAITCMQQMSKNPAVLIPAIIGAFISKAFASIWIAFQSATFTLAYHKLKK